MILGGVPEDLRRRVTDVCFRENKTLMLAPTMMDIMLAGAERIVMEDTLLYVLNTDRVDPAYRAVKRGLDVLVSALGLLILSPCWECWPCACICMTAARCSTGRCA